MRCSSPVHMLCSGFFFFGKSVLGCWCNPDCNYWLFGLKSQLFDVSFSHVLIGVSWLWKKVPLSLVCCSCIWIGSDVCTYGSSLKGLHQLQFDVESIIRRTRQASDQTTKGSGIQKIRSELCLFE